MLVAGYLLSEQSGSTTEQLHNGVVKQAYRDKVDSFLLIHQNREVPTGYVEIKLKKGKKEAGYLYVSDINEVQNF